MANNGDTQAGRGAVSLSDPLFFFDTGCPAAEQEAEYGPQPRQEGSGGATENIIWPFLFRVISLAAELRHRKTVTEYIWLSDDFARRVNDQTRQHSVGWANVAAATVLGQYCVIARAGADICRVKAYSGAGFGHETSQIKIIIIFNVSIGGRASGRKPPVLQDVPPKKLQTVSYLPES